VGVWVIGVGFADSHQDGFNKIHNFTQGLFERGHVIRGVTYETEKDYEEHD